jgi:hypothetical protein
MAKQLGEPFAIAYVGLVARDLVHMLSVDQHQLEAFLE